MSALQLHLAVVHLPVVLCPLAAVLLLVAMARKEAGDPLLRLGWILLLVAALGSVTAYSSGPSAFEQLNEQIPGKAGMSGEAALVQALVEDHAVVGRTAFVGMVLVGVLALQGLLQFLQGESPARWLRVTILVLALVLSYVLVWSAHLGGQVGHPEIRGPSILFPRLD